METLQLAAVIIAGIVTFFTVIGVFGLSFAITGLLIATAASIVLFWRSALKEKQP